MATLQDFWSRVGRGDTDRCWPWSKALFHGGHGAVTFNGKQDRAHRVAWILTHGPIPDGLCVLHRCDNPPCCNPAHLFLGSKRDNNRDRDAKGRTAKGQRSGRATKPERNPIGERNGRAKLRASDIPAIRSLRREGHTLASIGARFGVGSSTVHRVASGKAWVSA